MLNSIKIIFSSLLIPVISLMLTSTIAFSSPYEGYASAGSSGEGIYQTRLSIQLPDAFYTWHEGYAAKPVQKAAYLALGANNAWAAGRGYGYSTLSAAKASALEACNETRAKYSISDECLLYAENGSVVYLNDVTTPTPTPTPTPSTSPTLSPSFQIYIPSVLYSSPISGSADLWLRLDYSHETGGVFYWKLNSVGAN